jgi:NAD(P)H-dependent FMN reductase
MRIEIISGSPRTNSVTRRVALHLHTVLSQATEHDIGLIDMNEWDLPSMQSVFSSVANTPDQWKPVSERVFAADAFILVTPEYNGSYAPALKNLLDHFPKQHHKAFGIVTASTGSMGGMRATQQVLLLVAALFGVASPYLLVVPAVDKKFDKEGALLDASFQHNVQNFTAEFLWLAESVAKDKIVV